MKRSMSKSVALRLSLALSLLAAIWPAPPTSAATAAATTGTTIDASSFGANGADELDDAAAIQRAIDAAAPGDTVMIPEGTYYAKTTIRGKSGVAVTGANREATVVRFVGGTDAFLFHSLHVSNAEFSNMTLDGAGNPYAMSAVIFEFGNGNVIKNLNVKNFTASDGFGPHALLLNASTNAVISGNVITNIGPNSIWGAGIRAGWGSHGARIENNVIRDTGRGGIFANDGCYNTVVRGNTVSGSGLKEHGLSIELHTNCNYSLIEDNVADHWISAVRSEYVAVRDNVVKPLDDRVKGIGLEIMANHSVTTGNVVDGGQQVGIQQSPGTGYQYWGYNTVQNLVMWGMQLQGGGPDDKERFQYFYKNVFQNTRNDHPLAAYKGYDGNGVRIHGHAENITLDSNLIINNGRKGIEITGAPGVDRISFVNNTITGNLAESIDHYPADAAHLEWENNIVAGNGTDTQLTSRGFETPKPVADFSAPAKARIGEPVAFVNTSKAALPIVETLWDFGDGLPNTSASPTYVYEKEGTYRVTLVIWDAEGRASLKEQVIEVKKEKKDKKDPSAPTNVASPAQTDETIELVWAPASDRTGVVGYDVYQDGSLIGSTGPGITSFTATGLAPLTTYVFTVVAKDYAGNVSEPSALAVSTEAPDATPPTAPTNVTLVSKTDTAVSLTWSPSTDNKAVTGYEVFRGAVKIGATGANATAFTATGLAPGATYSFTVVAKDAAGNASAASAPLVVSMDPPGPVTYLSDLAWTSATVGWGSVNRDRSSDGKTITLNGVEYAKGLGTHAHSEIVYHLQGVYDRFQADVGVDDETYGNGAVTFEVWLDGVKAFDSGVMNAATETISIDLDIAGVDELKLIVTDGGNGGDWDHADWADAKILYNAE
ncbi:MAG TPA: NPCBM/NEW2 domain-containing protein [Paenibacillus sp.]|nr:NPCBM/NEW2 domain-containing protein [Paenibacillus sp.]